MRTFKNIKTGKVMKLDEKQYPNLIENLEKDKMFKELMII